LGLYSVIQQHGISVPDGTNLTNRISNFRYSVTDGDTVRVRGEKYGTRLVGFNTPETYKPQCKEELELGTRATNRLKELFATSKMELEKVPCSCKPGTQGTKACNFGRSCGILRADGRNVGEILVSEGLAVPFSCGPTSCPPLPRPWCK
jgi:endonuclease YncB( thermonuclease family)